MFLRGAHGRKGESVWLGLREVLIGVAFTLVITFLLVGFQFQTIPDFKVGDIADRTLEAPHDFAVEDKEATLENQEKTRKNVPAMFNLDLGVNRRVEAEFRGAFKGARELIGRGQSWADRTRVVQLPRRARRELLASLKETLPRFEPGRHFEYLPQVLVFSRVGESARQTHSGGDETTWGSAHTGCPLAPTGPGHHPTQHGDRTG